MFGIMSDCAGLSKIYRQFFSVNLKHLLANTCYTVLKGTDESASLLSGDFSPDPGLGSWTIRRGKYMPADVFTATGH